MKDSINDVGSILKELINLNKNGLELDSLYKKTISFLENKDELPNEITKKSKEKIEELNWLLEDGE